MQCPRRDRGRPVSSHHTAAGRGGRNFRQEGRIERKMSSDNLTDFQCLLFLQYIVYQSLHFVSPRLQLVKFSTQSNSVTID